MVLVSNLSDRRDVRYLKLSFRGTRSCRDGLGAVVKVHAGRQTYTKVYDGLSGYMSHSLYPLYFGLDDADKVEKIEVIWPSGQVQILAGPIDINKRITITEETENGGPTS